MYLGCYLRRVGRSAPLGRLVVVVVWLLHLCKLLLLVAMGIPYYATSHIHVVALFNVIGRKTATWSVRSARRGYLMLTSREWTPRGCQ
jgi:uncharacterized membrane protein YqjE